jgi:hypothetical protein
MYALKPSNIGLIEDITNYFSIQKLILALKNVGVISDKHIPTPFHLLTGPRPPTPPSKNNFDWGIFW